MAVDPAQPDRPSIHHRDGATPYVCSTWAKPATAPWSHDYGYCRHSLDQLAGVNDPRCPAGCPHKAPAHVVAEFSRLWESEGVAAAALEAAQKDAWQHERKKQMTNFDRVAAWHKACGKETNNAAHMSVGLGVHIEELAEQLECIRVDSDGWQRVLERAATDLSDLAKEIKSSLRVAHVPQHLREGFLKELCDGDVTGNAVAFLAGFDKNEADKRVLDSNDDKLIDGQPVILPGGKIGKRDGWTEPSLEDLV